MFIRFHLPSGRVGVAPLGTDRNLLRAETPVAQPGSQKRLSPAVRAGRVKIADPRLPGSVHHLVGMGFHSRYVVVVVEIVGMA